MIKRKIIFLILLVIFFIAVFFFIDFTSLFLNFPETKKELTDIIKKTGTEILTSSPLSIEGGSIYFSLDEKKVIEETNLQRSNYGIAPLKESQKLNISAFYKNEDMCDEQYFEHISPKGEGPADLVKKTGYDFVVVAENLALGSFLSEKNLINSWMESPGHRENILNENYTEIGVSVLRCDYKDNNVWLATQHFGTPLSSCPLVDESLKIKIDKNKEELNNLFLKIEEIKSEISIFKIRRGDRYLEITRIYGELVAQYNFLVRETEELIFEYNTQVISFNNCANSFQ